MVFIRRNDFSHFIGARIGEFIISRILNLAAYFFRKNAAKNDIFEFFIVNLHFRNYFMENCGADVIAEIARRLSPPDFLALRRTNRAIKSALDSRAKEIWESALVKLWIAGKHNQICIKSHFVQIMKEISAQNDIWLAFAQIYRKILFVQLKCSKFPPEAELSIELHGEKWNFCPGETPGKWIRDHLSREEFSAWGTHFSYSFVRIRLKEYTGKFKDLEVKLYIDNFLITKQKSAGFRSLYMLAECFVEIKLEEFVDIYVPCVILAEDRKIELKLEHSNGDCFELPPDSAVQICIGLVGNYKCTPGSQILEISWRTRSCIIIYNNETKQVKFVGIPKNLWDIHDEFIAHISRSKVYEEDYKSMVGFSGS